MSKIKVFIDCGHGGNDPGACNGYNKEKNITLPVGLLVKENLEKIGKFDVKMSRDYDTYITLEQRSKLANNWGADIFISIHCNSSDNKTANGVETFCYKFKYRKLADAINNGILDYININNRGVKEGNFHVIRETKMAACLTELAFISNTNDLNGLLSYQREFALGITKGILSYYNINTDIIESQPNNEKLYIVSIGAYKDINNAKKDVEELNKKGFNSAYIHTC